MPDGEQEKVVAAAVGPLFDIGMALGSGRLTRDEVQPVLDRTRAKVELLDAGFVGVIDDGPSALLSEIVFPDAYREVARTRSGLQFAIELYWDGRTPPALAPELERFDYLLEQSADANAPLAPDDVPAEIPRAHWWWRVPYEDRPGRPG